MKTKQKTSQSFVLPRFLFFFALILFLLFSAIFLSACEQEQVPEAPVQKVVEEPLAHTSDADILQQYPDDLDEALNELDEVEG